MNVEADSALTRFIEIEPSLPSYWRGVILFGRNVASYKFALGKSLLELADRPSDLVTLDELAEPFARHLCEHLQQAPKQATSPRSRFLDLCRGFNAGDITHDALVAGTARLGFVNVIDAFHVVGPGDIPRRFFIDERNSTARGIRLTDELRELAADHAGVQLVDEVEARWRLVETAWELGIGRTLIATEHDGELLVPLTDSGRRPAITTARATLNGYQKNRCFYCLRPISIEARTANLADVDHVLPRRLQVLGLLEHLDGVWNLVLACKDCNRGAGGKSDLVPALDYVERLSQRNEYLIASNHPLRETLIAQTGTSSERRRQYLNDVYNIALSARLATWLAPEQEAGVL